MQIQGRLVHGMGGAGRALRRQRRLFARQGLPGVQRLVNGTINIDTTPLAVAVRRYDFFFERVRHKSFPIARIEDFGFVRIARLSVKGRSFDNPGYLYVALASPHRREPGLVEVWAQPIEGLAEGDRVSLTFDDRAITAAPFADPPAA
jgi:hypothetical protein